MCLRRLAARAGLEVGACSTAEYLADEWYADLLAGEFDRLALENDLIWGNVRPQRGTFDFGPADEIVDFAERHGMAVTGHALVWHVEPPDWLTRRDWSREKLAEELRSHIHTVTEQYDGRIDTWDVVNEAVADTGELRETLWLEQLGSAYIEDAFQWASEHTGADLYYNDYGLAVNQAKQDRVYRLLEALLDRGVPIDGVGLQLHCVGVHPTPEQIQEAVERFQALGIEVRVTELDVAYDADDAPSDVAAAHAEFYRQTVGACLDAGVETLTFWGVTDDHSWLTSWRDYPDMYTQQPLLFDGDGRAKQSYDAVASALREHRQ